MLWHELGCAHSTICAQPIAHAVCKGCMSCMSMSDLHTNPMPTCPYHFPSRIKILWAQLPLTSTIQLIKYPLAGKVGMKASP